MLIKEGVSLRGLSNEMQWANSVATDLWRLFGEGLVITSGLEGEHKEGSKHYDGQACDYRTRYFNTDNVQRIANILSDRLGPDYDVVVEDTHIHCEYDPDKIPF